MNAPHVDALPPDEPERYELAGGPSFRFELQRRDVLKLVGGGLIVCVLGERTPAQESGRSVRAGGEVPDEIGAWVHVDEHGRVAVFTGKAEGRTEYPHVAHPGGGR
jgi:hypothetical protein